MASPVNSARLNDILSQLSCQLLTIHPASQANMFLGRVLLQRLPAPALLDVRFVSHPATLQRLQPGIDTFLPSHLPVQTALPCVLASRTCHIFLASTRGNGDILDWDGPAEYR
jgi:hypothetical protein